MRFILSKNVFYLLLQHDVEREAVVELAACGAELRVDGDRGHVFAAGEAVVQHAGDTLGDRVVYEWRLQDLA